MQSVLRALCVGLVLTGLAPTSHAELPPSAYDTMKAQSSDVVSIEVTRVALNQRDGKDLRDISVYAEAQVVGVTRSKSRLKVGDKISLRYMTFEVTTSGWVGPSPVLVTQTGTRYRAWVKKARSRFYAAAKGKSLEEAN